MRALADRVWIFRSWAAHGSIAPASHQRTIKVSIVAPARRSRWGCSSIHTFRFFIIYWALRSAVISGGKRTNFRQADYLPIQVWSRWDDLVQFWWPGPGCLIKWSLRGISISVNTYYSVVPCMVAGVSVLHEPAFCFNTADAPRSKKRRRQQQQSTLTTTVTTSKTTHAMTPCEPVTSVVPTAVKTSRKRKSKTVTTSFPTTFEWPGQPKKSEATVFASTDIGTEASGSGEPGSVTRKQWLSSFIGLEAF